MCKQFRSKLLVLMRCAFRQLHFEIRTGQLRSWLAFSTIGTIETVYNGDAFEVWQLIFFKFLYHTSICILVISIY